MCDSELSTDLPGPTVEHVLGVVWCVEGDTLQFRIVDSKPFTRRGIFSTVSSIYDPLCWKVRVVVGGTAPFLMRFYLGSSNG